MSNDLGFKRKFFILRKEYSNMRNVNPKGHGKLELRNNRLNLSLNINNAEKDQYYNVTLIGDNRVHEFGKIHTDKSHGGKVQFDYNYKDIESIGFPLEKINGILISRDTDILLGGYIEEVDKTVESYINRLIKSDIKPQKKEVPKEVIEVVEEVVDEQIIEAELTQADESDTIEETNVIEEIDVLEEPVTTEDKYIENDLYVENPLYIDNDLFIENDPIIHENHTPTAQVTEEEYDRAMQEVFSEYEESEEEQVQYVDLEAQRKVNQRNQTTNYVLNILSFFPYIEPFTIDLMGYNWWKINIDDPREDKGFLPYFSYISGGNHKYPLVQNTVTATALMRKHGHYLFGLYNVNDEVKFYVYGIPGKFTIEDYPQRGTTGFNTWFEGKENVGYWLLYIDPLTGRVIYPINPMIPKD